MRQVKRHKARKHTKGRPWVTLTYRTSIDWCSTWVFLFLKNTKKLFYLLLEIGSFSVSDADIGIRAMIRVEKVFGILCRSSTFCFFVHSLQNTPCFFSFLRRAKTKGTEARFSHCAPASWFVRTKTRKNCACSAEFSQTPLIRTLRGPEKVSVSVLSGSN